MAAFDLALLNDAADLLGALVEPASKGHRVELLGRTEIEGTPAWELRVDRAEGFVERIYLDAEHLVEIQQMEEHTLPSGGSEPLILVTTWGPRRISWARSRRSSARTSGRAPARSRRSPGSAACGCG